MLGISLVYACYGTIVSIYLYGRKVDFLRSKYEKEDAEKEANMALAEEKDKVEEEEDVLNF